MSMTEQQAFKNLREAHSYLQNQGYKISQSGIYEHARQGRLKKRNGVYTQSAVEKYAKAFLVRADTGKSYNDESEELSRQKQKEEIEKLKLNNERERRRLEIEKGKFVPREDFENELVARLVVLCSDFKCVAHSRASEFVHLVNGDQKKSDDLSIALVEAFDKMLYNYATTKTFHVLILPDEESQSSTEEQI